MEPLLGRPGLREALLALRDDRAAAAALLAAHHITTTEHLALLEWASASGDTHPRWALEWQDDSVFEPADPAVTAWALACMERQRKTARPALMLPVFAALLAAGVPLKPEWDGMVPVAPWPPHVPLMERIGRALGERRGAVFAARLSNEFSRHIVFWGQRLLALFPDPEVLALVLKHADQVDSIPKRTTLKDLAALAKAHPALQAPLDAALGKQPKPLKLKVAQTLVPQSVAELTPLQAEQLVAAGRAYDGKTRTAAAQLRAFAGTLQIRELSAAKGVAYTAFTYAADSGTVFAAGGTDVVAQIVQFGLQCSDARLKEALQVALAPPKAKR